MVHFAKRRAVKWTARSIGTVSVGLAMAHLGCSSQSGATTPGASNPPVDGSSMTSSSITSTASSTAAASSSGSTQTSVATATTGAPSTTTGSGGAGTTGATTSAGSVSTGGATATNSTATVTAGSTTTNTSTSGGAGGATSTSGTTTTGTATTGSDGGDCTLPSSFDWTSTGPIIAPKSDASHDLTAIKDPTVVFYNDLWHVYASSVSATGVYGMVYLNFTDFSSVGSGTFYHMDQTPGFNTYVAAPELFYFEPQNKWYLVFQSGPPMYSTNDDPGKPQDWTQPAPFFASEPAIITQNDGWLDFWVICDDSQCHLFFSDDHGRWYRSDTSLQNFPSGFSQPSVVMQDDDAGRLFEACNVYKLPGEDKYVALIEAFDSTSDWHRYFRSWTADALTGTWTPLADSGTNPFAGPSNVAFSGSPWTGDISHGEMIRAGYDQTLTLDTCDLRLLYQGADPNFETDNYNAIPWRIGLASSTQ